MTPAVVRRVLLRLAIIGLILSVLIALLAPELGFRWDPFDLSQRRISRLESQLAEARTAASASERRAGAGAAQSARVETHQSRVTEATRVVVDVVAQAPESPDALHPLAPDRAARLRDADRRLCGVAPDLCGADATPDPADGGDRALPAADPA